MILSTRTARAILMAYVVIALTGCMAGSSGGGYPTLPSQVARVTFTHRPASGGPDSAVRLCWNVTGYGTIPATGVFTHASQPDTFPWDGPTYYPDNAPSPRPVSLPGDFCTSVTLPHSGALYIGAYANGSRTYANLSDADVYTGPFVIDVTAPGN